MQPLQSVNAEFPGSVYNCIWPSIEDDMPPNVPPPRSPSGKDHLRLPPPPAMSTCVPPLPPAWVGTERMSDWLKAKAEEDKLRQEEERTRQENLRLEQRRTEHRIISESLNAGVPANLIPMIFNGMQTTGANPWMAMDMQRQWAPRGATGPQPNQAPPIQIPPMQRAPVNRPYYLSQPFQPPQPPQQPLQQPPQKPPQTNDGKLPSKLRLSVVETLRYPELSFPDLLDAAFKNTFPLIKTLKQQANAQTQPKGPEAGENKTKPVEYHHWTPQEMEPPRVQPSQPQPAHSSQWQSQSQSQAPINTVSSVPSQSPRQKTSTAKRKDSRPHEKLPPPVRQIAQIQTTDPQRDQLHSAQRQQQSDLSDVSSLTSLPEAMKREGDTSGQSSVSVAAPTIHSHPQTNQTGSTRGANQTAEIKIENRSATGARNEDDDGAA